MKCYILAQVLSRNELHVFGSSSVYLYCGCAHAQERDIAEGIVSFKAVIKIDIKTYYIRAYEKDWSETLPFTRCPQDAFD